jgi:6-phosphofructokinase 1|tara:strand:- start:6178 stop:7161 length:984 start_codon:yes stop_codon:yes gene_type:complete
MQTQINRIGVFTSGGDAPGMNAAIRAVVRSAIYYDRKVFGIFRGYQGMIEGDIEELQLRSVSNILDRGGTMLKSARSKEFRTKEGRRAAYEKLKEKNIDALVVIGGDGSFTGANIFEQEYGIPVIGIPGTIDNDLCGTNATIGYDSATNVVVECIDKIRDTASSHNRLFFIEVMGRDAGFIALRTGIATGAIAIMLPEKKQSIEDLISILDKASKRRKTSNIVIVAEGDELGGAVEIAKKIEEQYSFYETKVTVLGHIQRGGSPSCFDRVLASQMGVAAVEGLLEGESNVMTGSQNGKIVYVPLDEAIKHTIKLNPEILKLTKILTI